MQPQEADVAERAFTEMGSIQGQTPSTTGADGEEKNHYDHNTGRPNGEANNSASAYFNQRIPIPEGNVSWLCNYC